MKAAYYNEYGPASVLQYGEQPAPTPQARQILVRVRASGVNPADWKVRNGELKLIIGPTFPKIPGYDAAGEVAAIGAEVTRFAPGDRVYGVTAGMLGANAEYAVLDEAGAAFIPQNLGFDQAAAAASVSLTALQALRDEAPVLSGDRVLVNGASGGVGSMAVQLAWALGAGEVVGTSSAAHLELVRSLGVSQALDYEAHDFTRDQSRYDVVFDAAGKSSFAACKVCLRNGGRYVSTLPDPRRMAAAALAAAFSDKKQGTVSLKSSGSDLALISAWLQAGTLRVVIDKSFPLSDIRAAQEYSEQGGAAGKIVLTVE